MPEWSGVALSAAQRQEEAEEVRDSVAQHLDTLCLHLYRTYALYHVPCTVYPAPCTLYLVPCTMTVYLMRQAGEVLTL